MGKGRISFCLNLPCHQSRRSRGDGENETFEDGHLCVCGSSAGRDPPLFQIRSPSVAQACLELRDAPASDSRVVDY